MMRSRRRAESRACSADVDQLVSARSTWALRNALSCAAILGLPGTFL